MSPVGNTCVGSINGLVDESVSVDMTVVTTSHGQHLLNIETDSLSLELAVLVVHAHLTHGDFVGQELVLLENTRHSGSSLVNTAPGLDVASLALSVVHCEVDRLFADHKHLLKLHLIMLVVSLKSGFDIVLDLGLGLLTLVFLLEIEGRWNVVGQGGGEFDLVDAWVENATLDIEHAVLVLKELFAVLQLFVSFNRAGLVTMLLSLMPEADERALFATLEFKLNVRGFDGLHDLNVNDTFDHVAGLVEGALGLQLDLALGERASGIGEEKHP